MSNLIIRLCKAAKDTDGPLGDLLLEAAESISEKCTPPKISVNKDVLGGRTVTVGNVSVAGVKSVILTAEMVEMNEIRYDKAMRELAEKSKELADLKAAISQPAGRSPFAAGVLRLAASMQRGEGKSTTMLANGGQIFSVTRMRDQEADQQAELEAGGAQTEAPPVWQYCDFQGCWHDEGIGPFNGARHERHCLLAWRLKPSASGAEPQPTAAAQTAELEDQR